jgi:hypothetical protein
MNSGTTISRAASGSERCGTGGAARGSAASVSTAAEGCVGSREAAFTRARGVIRCGRRARGAERSRERLGVRVAAPAVLGRVTVTRGGGGGGGGGVIVAGSGVLDRRVAGCGAGGGGGGRVTRVRFLGFGSGFGGGGVLGSGAGLVVVVPALVPVVAVVVVVSPVVPWTGDARPANATDDAKPSPPIASTASVASAIWRERGGAAPALRLIRTQRASPQPSAREGVELTPARNSFRERPNVVSLRVFAKCELRSGTGVNGAAQESNLPSLGLPDLTGFEDLRRTGPYAGKTLYADGLRASLRAGPHTACHSGPRSVGSVIHAGLGAGRAARLLDRALDGACAGPALGQARGGSRQERKPRSAP